MLFLCFLVGLECIFEDKYFLPKKGEFLAQVDERDYIPCFSKARGDFAIELQHLGIVAGRNKLFSLPLPPPPILALTQMK